MRLKFKAVIRRDGTLEAVYNDFIPRLKLGPMQVTRASTVEFDEVSQQWEARDTTGMIIVSAPDRFQCLRMEQIVLERRLLGPQNKLSVRKED